MHNLSRKNKFWLAYFLPVMLIIISFSILIYLLIDDFKVPDKEFENVELEMLDSNKSVDQHEESEMLMPESVGLDMLDVNFNVPTNNQLESFVPYSLDADFNDKANFISEESQDFQAKIFTLLIVGVLILSIAIGFLANYLAKKSLKPLEESIESQKRFVSDASHELKTPLALIKSDAEILSMSNSENINEYKSFVQQIIKDVNYLDKLTNNLLYIAQLDRGSLVLNLNEFSLNKLVKRIIDRFDKIFENEDIQIDLEVDEVLWVGDEGLFEQALRIIIENSIKYKSKVDSAWVKILVRENMDEIILEVSDNGIGISNEDMQRVFERFYRVSKDRNDIGYGLGLSILKRICDLMSVKLVFESKVGVGTKVCMKIPKNNL